MLKLKIETFLTKPTCIFIFPVIYIDRESKFYSISWFGINMLIIIKNDKDKNRI